MFWQARSAKRNRREQHQSYNLFGVRGGDEFGDLCPHALADHDHRCVDTAEDFARFSGEKFERQVARIGDRRNAGSEALAGRSSRC